MLVPNQTPRKISSAEGYHSCTEFHPTFLKEAFELSTIGFSYTSNMIINATSNTNTNFAFTAPVTPYNIQLTSCSKLIETTTMELM